MPNINVDIMIIHYAIMEVLSTNSFTIFENVWGEVEHEDSYIYQPHLLLKSYHIQNFKQLMFPMLGVVYYSIVWNYVCFDISWRIEINKVALGMTDVLWFVGIIFMNDGCIIVKLKDAMEKQLILFAQSHNSRGKKIV